jgi:TPP-dependent pyruvate/acetoin dehydrogenase alpha subunit
VKYSNEELLRMHEMMVRARVYCEVIEKCCMQGRIIGMHHLSLGQEAVGAGIAAAMREDDWMIPTHRSQAAVVNRVDLYKYMAEEFGKIDGYCKGMGSDLHMSVPECHQMFPNGILGQNFAIATGFAYGLKMDGTDQVIVACEGDGAFSEGLNYEAFILCMQLKVPAVFIVEDNGYGWSYKSDQYAKNLAERCTGFGIPSVTVDGNDIIAVREAVEAAIATARTNQPCLVVCKTLRWGGHFVGGDKQRYRPDAKEEVAYAKKHNDPIKRFEKVLLEAGVATEEQLQKVWDDMNVLVNAMADKAEKAPFPGEKEAIDPHRLYSAPWEV